MKALGRRKLWSHVATKEKYGLLYDAFKSRDYLFGLVQYFLLGVMLSAIDIFLLSEHGRMISSFLAGWKLDTAHRPVQHLNRSLNGAANVTIRYDRCVDGHLHPRLLLAETLFGPLRVFLGGLFGRAYTGSTVK